MDRVVRASLGPIPLPYIFIIILLPVWTLFLNNDYSLLHSLCVVITILLKGSLFCHWSACRCVSWQRWLILLLVVPVLEIGVTREALHISGVPLGILVPLSSITAVLILRLHLGREETASSNVVGIFSRSSPEEYSWLSEELRRSGKVRPFCITNTNSWDFEKSVSQCSAAILYHSKNRGRLNITDVPDSLYDQEVQHMSERLGRNKVLVVVDDLDESSDVARRNILQSQPTISQKTSNLFLFTTQEKSDTKMAEKLQQLREAVSRGSGSFTISGVVAVLLLAAPWIYFLYDQYQEVLLVLSNISGSLLLCFLLPSRSGAARAGLAVLLMAVSVELVAVFWNYSGVRAGWLASQSLATVVYALYWALSSRSSGAARRHSSRQ